MEANKPSEKNITQRGSNYTGDSNRSDENMNMDNTASQNSGKTKPSRMGNSAKSGNGTGNEKRASMSSSSGTGSENEDDLGEEAGEPDLDEAGLEANDLTDDNIEWDEQDSPIK